MLVFLCRLQKGVVKYVFNPLKGGHRWPVLSTKSKVSTCKAVRLDLYFVYLYPQNHTCTSSDTPSIYPLLSTCHVSTCHQSTCQRSGLDLCIWQVDSVLGAYRSTWWNLRGAGVSELVQVFKPGIPIKLRRECDPSESSIIKFPYCKLIGLDLIPGKHSHVTV